jgi:hypothetical protein
MFSTAILLAASMVGGETHGGMPEELRQHIDKHVIGEWTTQTAWGDKVAVGESRSHWASGGKCVITEATGTEVTGEKSHVASVLMERYRLRICGRPTRTSCTPVERGYMLGGCA